MLRLAPWILGGVLGLVLIALVARSGSRAPASSPAQTPPPGAAGAAATPLPDISSLSPAERFDRLYQRIIAAAQSGDQATVTRFMPMAVSAFGMLDSVTVDLRYHLAMLELHVGDLPAAQAQADSIKRADPAHLFSYVIQAAVARWKEDALGRAAAYRGFLQHYDAEIAKKRPEYREHQSMLDEVKQAAMPHPAS